MHWATIISIALCGGGGCLALRMYEQTPHPKCINSIPPIAFWLPCQSKMNGSSKVNSLKVKRNTNAGMFAQMLRKKSIFWNSGVHSWPWFLVEKEWEGYCSAIDAQLCQYTIWIHGRSKSKPLGFKCIWNDNPIKLECTKVNANLGWIM